MTISTALATQIDTALAAQYAERDARLAAEAARRLPCRACDPVAAPEHPGAEHDTPKYRLAPSAERRPSEDVLRVIDLICDLFPHMRGELFVADWNHGDVTSEGAWSIAYEGHYDWPLTVCATEREHRTAPASLFLEPGAGWWLGVYPE